MRPRRYRGADNSLAIRLPTYRDCLPECPMEEGRPEVAENPRHDVRWCPHRQPQGVTGFSPLPRMRARRSAVYFGSLKDRFGIARKVVRHVVASEKLRKRLAQEDRRAAIRDSVLTKRQSSAGAAQSTVKTPHGADDVNTRPRDRITGLQLVARMDPAAGAGIVGFPGRVAGTALVG
jgi:hypothetical protein